MKLTVHIVEDDEANRNSLRDVLKIYGYSVAVYTTGEEFLADATLNSDSCVILDVNLPGVNGLEVLKRLRTRAAPIAAVIVSGRSGTDMRARADRLGALGFFEKPIDIDRLVATIDSVGRK
ncbi:MAG: response regulator transcription factor [Beijerinckiaceae bacterium]